MTLAEKRVLRLWREVNAAYGNSGPKAPAIRQRIAQKIDKLSEPWLARALSGIGWTAPEDGSRLVTTEQVSESDIRGLIDGTVAVLHVPGFTPRERATEMASRIDPDHQVWMLGGVLETDMCFGGGSIPLQVAMEHPEAMMEYFERRDEFEEHLREVHGGGMSVSDLLLQQLNECWPHGARRATIMFEKLRSAVIRMMYPGEGAAAPDKGFIHIDFEPELASRLTRLSANVYLEVPDNPGEGELSVWPVRLLPSSHRMQDRAGIQLLEKLLNFDVSIQLRAESLLPSPITVNVAPGDLVILNTSRPHAVSAVRTSRRVSVQSFIDFEGDELILHG